MAIFYGDLHISFADHLLCPNPPNTVYYAGRTGHKLQKALRRDPCGFLLSIDLGDVGYGKLAWPGALAGEKLTDEVNDTAGVAPLVVIPGDELDEVGVERDTGLSVEDGRVLVAVQVRGDNVILSVREDALTLVSNSARPEDSATPYP